MRVWVFGAYISFEDLEATVVYLLINEQTQPSIAERPGTHCYFEYILCVVFPSTALPSSHPSKASSSHPLCFLHRATHHATLPPPQILAWVFPNRKMALMSVQETKLFGKESQSPGK